MPGALFGLFEINPDTGEVVTTTTLDREVQEVLTLRGKGSLDCAKQTKTKTGSRPLRGEILHFSRLSLNKILLTQCYPVNLICCCLVRAAYFRYELMATICAIFCSLSVLVRDGGAPALSGTTTILCTVGDENDHAPEIIVPRHDIEVLENQEPGLVYTVLASDMDAGNNGAVRYHIIGKYYLYLNNPLPRIPTRLTHTSWSAFSIWYLVQCLQNAHLLRTDWCPGSPLLLPTATLIQCPPNSSKICP